MDQRGYVIDLGLIDYKRAWDLQHDLWSRRIRGECPDLLIFLEHPHVITLGRRGNRNYLMAPQQVLDSMGIAVYHVERGGDVTYHGPGQLVGYPILDLKGYGYRLIRYIDQLEEVILRTLKDFGVEGKKDSLNRGVWVNDEKIASIGVTIKQWVSFHGFALNYETDLSYFDLIHPCGLVGKKMTTMEKVLGEKVSRERLVERMLLHFGDIFQREWEQKELEDLTAEGRSQKVGGSCRRTL
ncbi:MAG: lipoyl(octanoyl) transferase LipB [Thermodesulfobacteriota bacterium]